LFKSPLYSHLAFSLTTPQDRPILRHLSAILIGPPAHPFFHLSVLHFLGEHLYRQYVLRKVPLLLDFPFLQLSENLFLYRPSFIGLSPEQFYFKYSFPCRSPENFQFSFFWLPKAPPICRAVLGLLLLFLPLSGALFSSFRSNLFPSWSMS